MSALKYWLWLSAAEGVSCKAKSALIDRYGDAETAYFAPEGEFKTIRGISLKEAAILEERNLECVRFIEEECEQQEIAIITMSDSTYPKRLKNIYTPPVVLYVKGSIRDLDELPLVAVIGTRRASPYGLKMGRKLAWEICRCGGGVISMLTMGIDSEAAKGALLSGGRCIGVLGTPHEKYPGSLQRDIIANGTLISEYPPGMTAQRSFFRERNRIASGISLGVVVVEAPLKSGTKLFVDEAAEQGKEIFAVPGNADAEGCAGSNALIKEGAKLVTKGAEVMEEFEALYPDIIRLSGEKCPEAIKKDEYTENLKTEPRKREIKKEKEVDNEKSRGYIDLREQLSCLSEDQLKIINAIDKKSAHIDDIIETTGLSAPKVLAQLTVLEIKGYVKREAGRRISLNIAKK